MTSARRKEEVEFELPHGFSSQSVETAHQVEEIRTFRPAVGGLTDNVASQSSFAEFKPLRAPIASKPKSIDGVVDEATAERVVVDCVIGDQNVRIALHPTLVPADLAKYGTPVTLSAVQSNGFRALRVTPRIVLKPHTLDKELIDWINC